MEPDLSAVLGSQLSQFDLSGLQTPQVPSFTELVGRVVSGQLDLSMQGVMDAGVRLFWQELLVNTTLIRQLLVIALLGALLRCLTDAFKHRAAGELGFFVTYIMAVLLAFTSFQLAVGLLVELVSAVSGLTEAAVPLILSLMAMSGDIAGSAMFQPLLIFAFSLVNRFITDLFIPLLLAAAALTVVNYLTEGQMLSKFSVLIRKAADLTLKGIVFLFALLLTLQKISAPIINHVALKTAKAAANAVPMVGGALNAAMDSVLAYASAAKSGVLVALIIVICLALAAPLMKMLAIMFVFKLTAAVAQPVCDERVANCLDQLGSFTAILTGAGALVGVMCLYSVVILLSF